MPPRVPIHSVSPTTVMVVTLSTGSPSKAFTSSQVVPSALSRLAPDANVPTQSRPTRSKARLVSWLLAIEPGSRVMEVNVRAIRSKRISPASPVAHQTTSSVTIRSA